MGVEGQVEHSAAGADLGMIQTVADLGIRRRQRCGGGLKGRAQNQKDKPAADAAGHGSQAQAVFLTSRRGASTFS